jgi:hypothetical protein
MNEKGRGNSRSNDSHASAPATHSRFEHDGIPCFCSKCLGIFYAGQGPVDSRYHRDANGNRQLSSRRLVSKHLNIQHQKLRRVREPEKVGERRWPAALPWVLSS